MKKGLSLMLALALMLALTACQSNTSPSSSSEPASNSSSAMEESSEPDSEPETIPEEEEEEPEEDPVDVDAEMIGDGDSVSVVVDGETLATFTLPTDSPIYYKLSFNEGSTTAVATHDIMEGISGRTIVELFEGDSQEYIDYSKSIVNIDETNAELLTKDLDGRKVLICKDVTPSESDTYTANYLVAVPVTDGVVLGFRIDAVNNPKKTVILDDSTIDLLLSCCKF